MRRARISTAAILLGIGLGGLLDGIVFHRILHWHEMLSAVIPADAPESALANMKADGWFDFAMWLAIAVGMVFFWSSFRAPGRAPSGQAFAGQLLIGWGGFNVVEGIVNHFILELHHVRDLPTHMPIYDWVFLALGGILPVVLGLALRDRIDTVPSYSDRRSGIDRRLGSMLH